MMGELSSLFMWIWPIIVGIMIATFVTYHIMMRQIRRLQEYAERRYYEGIQEGQKHETVWAREDAVEKYKLALRRKLADSGRRAVPRADAQPSKVHRLKIGPAPLQKPNDGD